MSKIPLRPLRDNVVIRQKKADEVTSFGLVLPDKEEKKQEGEVLAVGPGRVEKGVLVPMDVKVGDRILFEHAYGGDVEVEKEKYKIISQNDILAIIE